MGSNRKPYMPYKHTPDLIMRKGVAQNLLSHSTPPIHQGVIGKQWTYRRVKFILKNLPKDLTVSEYLMALLDDVINDAERAKFEARK